LEKKEKQGGTAVRQAHRKLSKKKTRPWNVIVMIISTGGFLVRVNIFDFLDILFFCFFKRHTCTHKSKNKHVFFEGNKIKIVHI
jgi:hypothetical protein